MSASPTERANTYNEPVEFESGEGVTSDIPRIVGTAAVHEVMATDDHEIEPRPSYDYITEAIYGEDTEEWKDHARLLFATTLPEIIGHDKSGALGRHVLDRDGKSRAAVQGIDKLRKRSEAMSLGKYDNQLKLNRLASALLAKQSASAALVDGLKRHILTNDALKDLSHNQVACLAVGIIDKLCTSQDATNEKKKPHDSIR